MIQEFELAVTLRPEREFSQERAQTIIAEIVEHFAPLKAVRMVCGEKSLTLWISIEHAQRFRIPRLAKEYATLILVRLGLPGFGASMTLVDTKPRRVTVERQARVAAQQSESEQEQQRTDRLWRQRYDAIRRDQTGPA